ncbi:MAG TPA: TetR family transcriptional regulator [Solirubrobacteraceae bacterium]
MASQEQRAGVRKRARPGAAGTGHARGVDTAKDGAGRERGVGREKVSEIQRVRILAAMTEVASERGAANVTVAHVVARSGVSRRTFYELFEDREACFLAAFDDAATQVAARVVPAYEGERRWRERIRAALAELLEFLDEEPQVGRLCVVEALAAGPRALERRTRALEVLRGALDEGREEVRGGREPPPLTAEGVLGAVSSVLHARLAQADGATGSYAALLNALMGMIVLPYLGPAAAAKELDRPPPDRPRRPRGAGRDPLRQLDMRLTYRTVRVLIAISQHPGASNRQLAEAAGVQDQGQISKLLSRLKTLGLIENTGAGPVRGEPNAWELTDKGRQIEQAIVQTAG